MSTLDELGHKYGTDKASPTEQKPHFHDYLAIYERYFAAMRQTAKVVLEIGIGYGGSMQMWEEYFPNAQVCGMDDFSEVRLSSLEGKGLIRVIQGDQSNRDDLARVAAAVRSKGFDIIIDDGGHTIEQQQVSLGFLFKYLKPGGLYVIEDLFTSKARGPKYNPTGTGWTTLKIMQLLRAVTKHDIASVSTPCIPSEFMQNDEQGYLLKHCASVHIERGTHSEIAFIRKVQ